MTEYRKPTYLGLTELAFLAQPAELLLRWLEVFELMECLRRSRASSSLINEYDSAEMNFVLLKYY